MSDIPMENDCPYCGTAVEHDGNEEYVQCSACGEISKYHNKKLKIGE